MSKTNKLFYNIMDFSLGKVFFACSVYYYDPMQHNSSTFHTSKSTWKNNRDVDYHKIFGIYTLQKIKRLPNKQHEITVKYLNWNKVQKHHLPDLKSLKLLQIFILFYRLYLVSIMIFYFNFTVFVFRPYLPVSGFWSLCSLCFPCPSCFSIFGYFPVLV